MKSLRGTKTAENLMKAFAGESQARTRYAFYESVAKKEGYTQISKIFKETANNEKYHAKEFFNFLKSEFNGNELEVNGTYPVDLENMSAYNLSAAAKAEFHESEVVYPTFADIAEQEGFPEIATKFRLIAKIEGHHSQRFAELFNNLNAGALFQKQTQKQWICNVCGYIHTGNTPPEVCPVCSHPKTNYQILTEEY